MRINEVTQKPNFVELLKMAGYENAAATKSSDIPTLYAAAEKTKKFIMLLDTYGYQKIDTGRTTDHSYNPRDNLPLYQYIIEPGVAVTVVPHFQDTGLPGWMRSDSIKY